MSRNPLVLGGLALATVVFLAAGIIGVSREPEPQTNLVPATILHVDEGESWQSTETLLELDDGRRITRRAYLGPVGDELVIEVPR